MVGMMEQGCQSGGWHDEKAKLKRKSELKEGKDLINLKGTVTVI